MSRLIFLSLITAAALSACGRTSANPTDTGGSGEATAVQTDADEDLTADHEDALIAPLYSDEYAPQSAISWPQLSYTINVDDPSNNAPRIMLYTEEGVQILAGDDDIKYKCLDGDNVIGGCDPANGRYYAFFYNVADGPVMFTVITSESEGPVLAFHDNFDPMYWSHSWACGIMQDGVLWPPNNNSCDQFQ
jgi:hypothetical protein